MTKIKRPIRVLVADDHGLMREAIRLALEPECDIEVVGEAERGDEVLPRIREARPDVLLLDIRMPGMDGLEVLARVRTLDPEVPVVVISGHGSIETAVKAVRMGAQDFVEKPLALEKTLLVVKNALRQRKLEAENRALKRSE